MEEQAYAYFAKIDQLGGMVAAVKENYPQREIADAALRAADRDRRRATAIVVGVNKYTEGDDGQTPLLRIDPALERKQIDRVQAVEGRRDDGRAVEAALVALREAAGRERHNLMPLLIDAARVHCSEGEIIHALQDVWGAYTETPVY